MPPPLPFTVVVNTDRLKGIPQQVESRLVRRLGNLGLEMVSTIKADKLSGQVLRRVTGKLSRSIHREVEVVPGRAVILRIYAGREAPYAKPHEYGLLVVVPAHLRNNPSGDHPIFVRSYTVQYRERSFLRSTVGEYRDRFGETVHSSAIFPAPR